MAENRLAHSASTGAAGDSYARLLPNHAPGAAPPPEDDEDEHAFATEAEETAYWQGVADGIRNEGGKVPPRLAARAAKGQLLVQVHDDAPPAPGPAPDPAPGDILEFEPTQLKPRHDGWSPQKQREFVEALADTGIVRAAAARVGMTEQSANRLRRRPDARAFDRACDAALKIGARRILSIAYERAIEGTVKRHYFHGELKAEERVYDNRLLIALVNKLPPDLLAPTPETEEVAANWEPWMEAVEQGRDAPPPPPAAPPPPSEVFEGRVWTEDGDLVTDCPPPEDFDGYQEGQPGERFYIRGLTADEEEWWEEEGEELAETEEVWGMTFHHLGRPTFFPWQPEPSETSAAAAEPEDEVSKAHEASGESRPGPADGSAPAEPDRRRGFADAADADEES